MINDKAVDQSIKKYKEIVKKDFLLHPVSSHDKDIVMALVALCKNSGVRGVEQVMENYKMHPDSEILEGLVKLSGNKKEEKPKKKGVNKVFVDGDDDGIDDNLYTMVKFADLSQNRIFRPNIIAYFKWEDDDGVPFIVLNPCDETLTKQPIHANLMLQYDTEEDRDKDFQMMDEFYD